MTHRWIVAAVAFAALLPITTAPAQAAAEVVDVTGVQSFDPAGDPLNTILTPIIGAGSHVTGIGWDVNLFADDPSWLSEAGILFGSSSSPSSGALFVGLGDDTSGTEAYAGFIDLLGLGQDFIVDADGILRLEFHESFDDFPNDWDAVFSSGSLTFIYDPAITAVPEPATWAMMLVGFGAVGFAMRRRKRTELTVRRAA